MNDERQIDWRAADYRLKQRLDMKPKLEPAIDEIISHIVGFKVYQCDPRVLKLIVKWKKSKSNENEPDNFLENPKFIEELNQTLNQKI